MERPRILLKALGVAVVSVSLVAAVANSAELFDANQEKISINSLVDANNASDAAANVRKTSKVASTLAETDLDSRLGALLRWMVRDYASSGSLRLLSAVPSGANAAGETNDRLTKLKSTYWLQDNNLYGAGAFLQYAPVLGQALEQSTRAKFAERFPSFCADTESSVVVGRLGTADRSESGPKCGSDKVGPWQMLRMRQYPSPSDSNFDSLAGSILGTDYPASSDGTGAQVAQISRKSPRDLLKYGCLRQVLLGNRKLAGEMFDLALATWDGNGFRSAKSVSKTGESLADIYWTRDLAFALLCANALGQGEGDMLGSRKAVPKGLIEKQLWESQASDGGIWTTYCVAKAGGACADGRFPKSAKETNEIAPLVLLAYGRNIWAGN